jgi:hypothetical protein
MRIRRAPRPDTSSLSSPAVAGSWHSADGTVKLTLHHDARYDLSVAGRKRAARGAYWLDGDELPLLDDTGLRTPARIVGGGVIEMAGHQLYPLG